MPAFDERAIRGRLDYGAMAPGTEWGEVATNVKCVTEQDNLAVLETDDHRITISFRDPYGQWKKGRRYLVHIFYDDGR